MSQTIHETIESLHKSLCDYIEATYHIGNKALIAQRRRLLAEVGVTAQIPYLESTPRYMAGKKFSEIDGLSTGALKAYATLARASGASRQVIHDPAYTHQVQAVQEALVNERNLVIMTGTGSGKTESFLLPIIGKFATEASRSRESFATPAMRALILYPMNALVNDQLGRLRAMFGDQRLVGLFEDWAGRPARFARYTSRTPYAGVRTSKRDQRKFKAFEDFYVEIERSARDANASDHEEASKLLAELKLRGKWPSKPSLADWFGKKGSHWQDKNKAFIRAVTQPLDAELLTRHEVQANPPDLLVTNYSMLEYMLMRPIERGIFDASARWLAANPSEKFIVVLDEAHLYRGASGAEVGLLLRRFRDRLGIPLERLQVICATASFKSKEYAPEFGAQLSGAPAASFIPITGDLRLAEPAIKGSVKDAEVLSELSLADFYQPDEATRRKAIAGFLAHRGVGHGETVETTLYEALRSYGPLGHLINFTMRQARPLSSLGSEVFDSAPQLTSDRAVSALLAIGSVARKSSDEAGLLPCRIHNFFRGLPGLWACMDPSCAEVHEADAKSDVCGRLYGQPRERCGCGARVLELFTCRNCGTAYGRAYTDNVENPNALWSDRGQQLRMDGHEIGTLLPIDLLLESPTDLDAVENADYDLETGRLNSAGQGLRMRTVYLRKDRVAAATNDDGDSDTRLEARGQFTPCGVCGGTASFSRSSVQDHQTKGDQPFQTLVSRQIQVQPPSAGEATEFAPLRGRKVLVFSDSRQVAARLAPNLQMYSTRDSLRPLLLWGYNALQAAPVVGPKVSLDDAYLAVLLASCALGVRLRPELASSESFDALGQVEQAVKDNVLDDPVQLLTLWAEIRSTKPPVALLDDIYKTIYNKHIGLESLALASIAERAEKSVSLAAKLPPIEGIAQTQEEKLAIVRAWLRCWAVRSGTWFSAMPDAWWMRPGSNGTSVRGQKSPFKAMSKVLPDKSVRKLFDTKWLPILNTEFTNDVNGTRRLEARHLTLKLDGEWAACRICRSVHRPVPTIHHCLDCGSSQVHKLLPDADEVFVARKGYYRSPVTRALSVPPVPPMALIAAEHTAQLNAPQTEDVFSKAEENELLFQDVELKWRSSSRPTAIDVLSSTTTMEVGIDIGALSGVALRNMPPGRANYQQRAGRAGRRGNAVATVVAFGSADSHDEHYFSFPDAMIAGDVVDPKLTLDNDEIARRHIRAYLLQRYHQARIEPGATTQSDLFSVLGSVAAFHSKESRLNKHDFASWLADNEVALAERVKSWLPNELNEEAAKSLISSMREDTLSAIIDAIGDEPTAEVSESDEDDVPDNEESPSEEGDEKPAQLGRADTLLDRLLYCGKLPRYAFPTDVASFHVFNGERSTEFRPVMKFAPSQGLPIALSQYAPGKEVWISGKCYISGAVYSPIWEERFAAFKNRRLYQECSVCGFACTVDVQGSTQVRSVADCPACGTDGTFGPARYWLRPPGFAHPVDVREVTSPDDMPETSYATRAKLTMKTPPEGASWLRVNDAVRVMPTRQHLLVSNTGPDKEGYTYCSSCGRIEATSNPHPSLFLSHAKPFPTDGDSTCDGGNFLTKNLVLGTDFITDVALISLRVAEPLRLRPGTYPTQVGMRTVSEALARAACVMLQLEPGEIAAEFRPALTKDSAGREGLEAEVFLYDTLPGGAGFSTLAAQDAERVFEIALDLLKSCPANCETSCYRCMRSFKNKVEHSRLDRHVGIELLEHVMRGSIPEFSSSRMKLARDTLQADLLRQQGGETSLQLDLDVLDSNGNPFNVPLVVTTVGGRRIAVLISAPLTDDALIRADAVDILGELAFDDVVVVNELVIRANLPAATLQILDAMT